MIRRPRTAAGRLVGVLVLGAAVVLLVLPVAVLARMTVLVDSAGLPESEAMRTDASGRLEVVAVLLGGTLLALAIGTGAVLLRRRPTREEPPG